MEQEIFDIIQKSKFVYDKTATNNSIIEKGCQIIQIGIGDILLVLSLLKNNIIASPVYINLSIFIENPYKLNNITNCVKFRMELLNKISSLDEVIFFKDNDITYTNWQIQLRNLKTYDKLQQYFDLTRRIQNEKSENKYIIFHTKCRFFKDFDYANLKTNLKTFFKQFKTDYKIILLGEKNIPNNFETECHGITTIYEELLELNKNNTILDLTIDNIYDNLNFENFCKDISIVHNAETNILVGHGGHYCNSILFGKNICVYTAHTLMQAFNVESFNNNKLQHFFDIQLFFDKLCEFQGK
jgi:hypothetical protein